MGKAVVNKYQPSISEWFALISETKEAEAFRVEDNQKVDRLEFLYQKIGLPYERPNKLEAADLTKQSAEFKKILVERGDELCAIRLVPKEDGLPKIRSRGLTIRRCYEDWYLRQNINPKKYTAYICPHIPDIPWSMIFVVKEKLIFGEIISGGHAQLTQGTTKFRPIDFQFDYKTWSYTDDNDSAMQVVKQALELIRVKSKASQKAIGNKLKVKFYNDYLAGYFEAVVWPDGQIHFIDYNRLLPKFIPDPPPLRTKKTSKISGKIAYSGRVEGRVKIVNDKNIGKVIFEPDMILVCENTDVRYLPFMRQARAIVTDRGGLLSHAAIVARELKIPTLVDTKIATKELKNDQLISVDCNSGCISVDDLSQK